VPESLVTSSQIRDQVVAKVASVTPLPGGALFAVTIDFNAALASEQLPQLLNLVYGNISIKNNIRLVELALPAD
jgi:ribulose-bisphosphate carboxylase large chain